MSNVPPMGAIAPAIVKPAMATNNKLDEKNTVPATMQSAAVRTALEARLH